MRYIPESEIRVKYYDHSNFSRASIVQFRVSRWVMSSNRTSEWNVMTIRISRELLVFNFERLDELCPRIEHPCEMLWPLKYVESFRCSISSVSISDVPESDIRVKIYDHLNFSRASVVLIRVSRYIMRQNRTSEWKVMTISISQELPLFNFEHLDMWYSWIGPPCDNLWRFEFL